MRRLTSLLLALALSLSLTLPAAAASERRDPEAVAVGLRSLGLLLGGKRSFELDRQPTRLEAVILLLRLMGHRDEELRRGGDCPFRDVPDWARGYVARAWELGLTAGSGAAGFLPDEPATATMCAAFVLRAMGYGDDSRGGEDFVYANAANYAAALGLLDADAAEKPFTRGDCVLLLAAALDAAGKDGEALWEKLVRAGSFTEAQYRDARAEMDAVWRRPAAGGPAYQSLYPDFYAPQSFRATVESEKTVHLTFDDGPSERTDEVLATLREKNVKATFFVVGQSDEANLERLRQIVAQGHTIGMHSYSHSYTKLYASVESFLADFYRNFRQIKEVTGVTPTAFRFPGGSVNGYNKSVRKAIIAEMERRGFVPYDWNVTSGDAAAGGAREDQVFGNIVNQSAQKSHVIVLCHDSAAKRTTAQALPSVIDALRENGFRFAAISPTTKPYLFS